MFPWFALWLNATSAPQVADPLPLWLRPPHSAVQPLLCRVHAGGEDSWEIGGVVDVMDLAKLALESAWGACGDRCWVGLGAFLWPPFAWRAVPPFYFHCLTLLLHLGFDSRGNRSECGRGGGGGGAGACGDLSQI